MDKLIIIKESEKEISNKKKFIDFKKIYQIKSYYENFFIFKIPNVVFF